MNRPPRKQAERGLFAEVWREFNRLIDYCAEISPTNGRGIKINRTPNGTTFSVDPGTQAAPSTPGEIQQYRVISVLDDYLICRAFDGTSESGDQVNIAKPFNLRKTGWHGVSVIYTLEPYPGAPATRVVAYNYLSATYRTATVAAGNAVGSEHQVIIPRYVPARSIIFATGSTNGTGVPAADDLIDINADARAWARVL